MKARCVGGWMIAVIFMLLPAHGRKYKLHDEVQVEAEVRLADLLPAEAPAELRRASTNLDLCRAPQPGTVRVLSADFIADRIAGLDALRQQIIIPPEIVLHRLAWRAGGESMREALIRFFADSGNQNFDLPATAFWRGVRGPLLAQQQTAVAVENIHPSLSNHEMFVKLRCIPRDACHEFLLQIPQPPADLIGAPTTSSPEIATGEGSSPWLVRSGSRALAQWRDDTMTISQPVICLERGSRNQIIRVLNVRSHRVFLAEVVNPTLLVVRRDPSSIARRP